MKHLSNDTTEFYDAIAQYYPYFYRDWERQMEREGLGLRSIFRGRDVKRVLDASCGAGAQSIPLAQLGFEVVAADPSPGMLEKARESAVKYGVADKIEFVRADFLSLPHTMRGTFDAIVSKGNALAHLLLDSEIESTLRIFYGLLRDGGTLVIGMRDFGEFMEMRPGFLPGAINREGQGELITFDVWEWEDGPPVIATQNLYIVHGEGAQYGALKRQVMFRPLSTDEVKVVLMEAGFTDIKDQPDRAERVLVATK